MELKYQIRAVVLELRMAAREAIEPRRPKISHQAPSEVDPSKASNGFDIDPIALQRTIEWELELAALAQFKRAIGTIQVRQLMQIVCGRQFDRVKIWL
jgi:hypothetical protein